MFLLTLLCTCRCVGRLVRFIHNRDLATENLVRAYVRHSLLHCAPAKERAALHAAVARGDLSLEKTSLLRSAKDLLEGTNGTPGDYDVVVHRSPKDLKVTNMSSDMTTVVQETLKKLQLSVASMHATVCLASKVHVNGRPYSNGDFIEYALNIPRRRVAHDVALVEEGKYYKVARIVKLYLVPSEPKETVFLSVLEVPVHRTYYGIRHLEQPPDIEGPDVLNKVKYIHIDSVLFKLKVVPEVGKDGEFVAMRIWEAR